jgi:hypothetical protein|tara:strand:- start:9814 stop:11094 length:1281 start_codon:yes stop_codon:yes gene_type:complete
MKKLTIGSAVYDDFDGVYFSYQSIRLNNQEIWDDLDLLIIDNNPESAQGKATKSFCEKTRHIRYVPYTEKKSTTVRNEIFKNAEGKFCMSIDCHVLFEPDTIKKLIKYFEDNSDTKDLFHGPMFYDVINGHDPCTHMDPVWRDHMYGTWGYDKRGNEQDNPPFEIPMHGLGIFACKTDQWLGFNENFIGFGGEEGYIHKKYEKAGRKTWCLPFLRWLHRFDRPAGVKYPLILEHRIKNYINGHKELGLPYDDIIDHFNKTNPNIDIDGLIKEVEQGDFTEVKDPPKPASEEVKLWEKSEINFNSSSPVRYIKYEINDSYDGNSCLSHIDINPKPKQATIKFCSSEDPNYKSENLLTKESYWKSNPSDTSNFPHRFIIDLNEDMPLKSITAFPRFGLHSGLPKKFKVYLSSDEEKWKEISDVDIEKS